MLVLVVYYMNANGYQSVTDEENNFSRSRGEPVASIGIRAGEVQTFHHHPLPDFTNC